MKKTLALTLGLLLMGNTSMAAVNDHALEYRTKKLNYSQSMQDYQVNNDYLNFSTAKSFPVHKFVWTPEGIPMVKYGSRVEYNPVTVEQAALHFHGKYLTNGSQTDKENFLNLASALLKMQSSDGAFRYTFEHRIPHLKVKYKKGWVSAMAQGQALSVYSRAYEITKDVTYKRAGNAALNFLLTPISKGGVMTDLSGISSKWKNEIWFEEYVSTPNNYTLNGYIYTLIGLYDWGYYPALKTHGGDKAKTYFNKGQDSVKKILKKYDTGHFTSYDLSHLTMKQERHIVVDYHKVHIYQMYVMYGLTKSKYYLNAFNKWKSYID